ncbi:hypothetical protein V8C35DRAFT_326452 [Trichoderma chlorosporum]
MSVTPNRHVLLFAGQGSHQYLTNPAHAHTMTELLLDEHLEAFKDFLRQCRKAFHIELESASDEERFTLEGCLKDAFQEAESFLSPSEALRSHPIVETLSLYTHQVLELMLFQSHNECKTVIEASGICTGILPAILAASFVSYSSPNFIASAVELFRLAFWIGLRASLPSRSPPHVEWQKAPCLLSVFGISAEDLGNYMNDWKDSKHGTDGAYGDARISGIFGNKNISICGSNSRLNNIKSKLAAENIDYRWANVHAVYHGGNQMQHTLQNTLSDVERRGIEFPNWDMLHIPLWLVTDGSQSSELKTKGKTLLDTALRSIFIDMVDWRTTSNKIFNFHLKNLDTSSSAKVCLTGIGPGSKMLFHSFQFPKHPNLDMIESWFDYMSLPSSDDIAIVGLSVNYPGGSDIESFWETIKNGISTVQEIPTSRFDVSNLRIKENAANSEKLSFIPQYGNFLDNSFDFDASYFNISPREAKSMDPQQRLLLHAALDALEDAGYRVDASPSFQRDTFGVYVGAATGDYVDNLRDDIDVYYSPGTLRAFLSGRISYAFKFKGPSIVFDTACSSSMIALYQACRALKSGECTAALALGVNTMSSPDMYSGLGRAHFLSPSGQCKPFDKSADGYCRGEGCGGVVVKRLADAVAEGDHIYGVIRGIDVNQCGAAKSITHPHAATQEALFRSVIKKSRVTPDSINVVEAHGTGTQAGDYAEVSSLAAVFGSKRSSDNPLHLSSVKGNIGHSEAASGVAGLAKLLLMMENKMLLPQASHEELNPRLRDLMSSGKLRIPTRREDWDPTPGHFARRALINNFGASGSNVALVLEEYKTTRGRASQLNGTSQPPRSHHVLSLSAKKNQTLGAMISKYISYLTKNGGVTLADVCYSTNARRQHYSPSNLSVVASNSADLLQQLSKINLDDIPPHPNGSKKLIFSFSGQGDVHMGMGAGLLSTVPNFRKIVVDCDTILSNHGFSPVTPFLSNNSVAANKSGIVEEDVVVSQCACFILQYALAKLWMSWGIVPDLIVGHSIGEYAAFAISGALSLKEALLLVANRAQIMVQKCAASASGMLACRMLASIATKVLSDDPIVYQHVTIACYNSPQDIVLSGPVASLARFASYCKREGIKHKVLQVPYGFHSPFLDPILEDLAKASAGTTAKAPRIPIGSSLFGRLLDSETPICSDYFVRHARNPVKFSSLVSDMEHWSSDDPLTILEIGPSGSTESMFKAGLNNRSLTFLSSLRPTQGTWATLATALQKLSQLQYPIDWRAIYHGTSAKFLRSLPRHALNKSTYFTPYKFSRTTEPRACECGEVEQVQVPTYALLSLLPQHCIPVTSTTARFTTTVKQISRFVKAHTVGGSHLCPASVYMEIVLQAAAHQGALHKGEDICVFDKVSFEHPFVLTEQIQHTDGIETQLDTGLFNNNWEFTCTSKTKRAYCNGQIRSHHTSSPVTTDLLCRKMVQVERLKRSFTALSGRFMQTFSTRTIYDMLFSRVVEYKEPYLTLRHLSISDSGLEGRGTFVLEPLKSESGGRFLTTPAFLDTLLHTAGFIANTYVSPDIACICVSLEHAMVSTDMSEIYGKDIQVYCCIGDIGKAFIADAYALDPQGILIAYVEGMCFKKINLQSFKTILARSTTTVPNARPATPTAVSKPTLREKNLSMPESLIQSNPSEENRIRSAILSTICHVCGLDRDPPSSKSLEELGIDSLLLIELSDTLRNRFSRTDFSKFHIEDCKTIEDLITAIAEASETGVTSIEATPMRYTKPSPETSSYKERVVSLLDGQDDLVSIVRSVFMDVCRLDPTAEMGHRLCFLGVDSLMTIELADALRSRLNINIDHGHGDISELTYQQLEDLCKAHVTSGKPPSSVSESSYEMIAPSLTPEEQSSIIEQPIAEMEEKANCPSTLLYLNPTGRTSLYMFHDGSGLSKMYARLDNMNRNVYGISSLSFPSFVPRNTDAQTMEELASYYIKSTDLGAESDIILGGWSFGGVLAFEVSRQLQLQGTRVKGVILVDSPVPKGHEALPRQIISYILDQRRNGSPSGNRVAANSEAAMRARASIESQFRRHADMLQCYNPKSNPHGDVPCVIIRCAQNMDTMSLCGVEYPFLGSSESRDQSTREWENLTGQRIPVLDVDCNHFEVFDDAFAAQTSSQVEMACKLLRSSI